MSSWITMVVHAESKAGKTRLGATSPTPILVLDAEAGGFRFVPGRKITWDPLREDVPDAGDWDICLVQVRNTRDLDAALQVVRTESHPFASVVLDSISEFQSRLGREIQGSAGFIDQQGWGRMLNKLEDIVMGFRDCTEEQAQLRAFIVIAGTEFRDGKFRPLLQGGMKKRLSYKLDVTGYLFTMMDDDGELRRGLRVIADSTTDAGNRCDLPEVIWDPTVTSILEGMSN